MASASAESSYLDVFRLTVKDPDGMIGTPEYRIPNIYADNYEGKLSIQCFAGFKEQATVAKPVVMICSRLSGYVANPDNLCPLGNVIGAKFYIRIFSNGLADVDVWFSAEDDSWGQVLIPFNFYNSDGYELLGIQISGHRTDKTSDSGLSNVNNSSELDVAEYLSIYSGTSIGKEDVDTQRELIRIFEFAHKMNPVPTQQLNVVRPDFKSRELITENRVLVSSKLVGSGASQVRINNYEDRVYYKQTDWKNNVTYSAKEVKRAYNETKRSTVNVEKKVFVDGTHDTPIFRTEKYGGRRYGIAGPRRTRQVFDHTDRKTSYSERERDIITNPDGVVSYGEWRTIRSWNDVTRV